MLNYQRVTILVFQHPLDVEALAALCRLRSCHLVEGSLEVKLPTIWTDEKQSRAEAERRERFD